MEKRFYYLVFCSEHLLSNDATRIFVTDDAEEKATHWAESLKRWYPTAQVAMQKLETVSTKVF